MAEKKPKMDGDGTRELMPQETDPKRAAKPPKKGEVPVNDRMLQESSAEDLPLADDDPTNPKNQDAKKS